MLKTFKHWVPLAIIITALCGLLLVAVQQNYRQNADDPQVQISEDIAAIVEGGEDPSGLNQQSQTDISKSLATFIVVYGDDGKPVAGNAQLDGKLPELPSGVLDYAKQNHQNRITWQPKDGLRFATIITRYEGTTPGYIMVGRSLREIERRKADATLIIAIGWLATMAASFISVFAFNNYALFRRRFHTPTPEALTEEQK